MNDTQIAGGVVQIFVDGTPLTTEYSTALYSTTVDQRLNAPSRCTIAMNPVNFSTDTLRGLDFEVFSLGAELRVEMGTNVAEPVFTGQVTAIEPSYDKQCRRVNITAYDASYKLQFGTKARVFQDMTYSAIASEVLEGAGLVASVDPTEAVHPYTAQINLSDYSFLKALASRLGYDITVDTSTISILKPRLGDPPVATLEYGVGLRDFSVRARVLTRGSSVSRVGWDPKTKSIIESEAASADPDALMGGSETGFEMSESVGASPTSSANAGIVDLEGAQELASGARGDLMDGFVTGDGLCNGTAAIKAGVNLEVSAVGDRFNGLYYVTGAIHNFALKKGYSTRAELRRTGL